MTAKHLHFDCRTAGIAGDMTIGALIDLGTPPAVIAKAFDQVGIGASCLNVERVKKAGISATNVTIDIADKQHSRSLAEIATIINGSNLPESIKKKAIVTFDFIANAEVEIHDSTREKIHFHEVGALDAIADVVGVAAAMEYLEVTTVSCSVVGVGSGMTDAAHGKLPLPAPATQLILKNANLAYSSAGVSFEICTPTGAAILATYVNSPPLSFAPKEIGYGAGDLELADRPNVVRVTVGTVKEQAASKEKVTLLEANIDDDTPERLAFALEDLLQQGAYDAWLTPITMKKSRMASKLSALVPLELEAAICESIINSTSTLGVRVTHCSRRIVKRHLIEVEVRGYRISVKIAERNETTYAPEYEDCAKCARELKIPISLVMAEAVAAATG